MSYSRKDYAGGAADTTIVGDITSGSLTISVASSTGWPTGSGGPFTVVIDAGTASEEKVLVTSRSSTVLTVASSGDRGFDGTTATSHSSGATIQHCLAATDLDEANYAVAQTVGTVTTAGDLLVASGANAFTRKAKGSNSTVFGVDSGGTQGYTTVTNAMVAAGTGISLSKLAAIADDTVLANISGSSAAPSAVALTDFATALGVSTWTTIVKSTNESVTSSTTMQADDELVFTAANGTLYEFECLVTYSNAAGATPDIKVRMYEGGSGEGVWHALYFSTADAFSSTAVLTTSATGISAGTEVANRGIQIRGWHRGAGGSFGLGWAQDTSNGTATIVKADSILRYRVIV